MRRLAEEYRIRCKKCNSSRKTVLCTTRYWEEGKDDKYKELIKCLDCESLYEYWS